MHSNARQTYWFRFMLGLVAGTLIASFLVVGMSGCSEPTIPMPDPGTRLVPPGTPVTAGQLQAALAAEQRQLASDERIEQAKAKRQLRSIQREAETASESAITAAQDKAEEISENVVLSSDARRAKLEVLTSTIAQAQADLEARQNVIQNITQLAAVGLQNSGLPGGGLAASLLVGLGGVLWGSKKAGDAKSERAASQAHDEAWEESKKELMALIATMRGVGKE